ncbi:hypothetical protein C8F01DRAFT_1191571 [Mycena amicta]|nr:hypothetical protein C8F01DRAFT_1191571 [Mycena amicta]
MVLLLQNIVATAFTVALEIMLKFLSAVLDIFRAKRTRAPIDALPNELLVHIFSYVAGSYRVYMDVCRRWREVALHSPTLWNNLDFKWRGIRGQNICPLQP